MYFKEMQIGIRARVQRIGVLHAKIMLIFHANFVYIKSLKHASKELFRKIKYKFLRVVDVVNIVTSASLDFEVLHHCLLYVRS